MSTIIVSGYSTMSAFGKILRTSCIIKKRGPGDTIAFSEKEDGSQGIPYQPLQFPLGTWIVGAPEATTHPLMAPYFIPTNAHQIVPGLYGDGVYADDFGYGIHFDAQFEETWGCLHLYSSDDAKWLAGEVLDCQKSGEIVQLVVS